MEFHGPIVRPYTDADSLFIEVTTGCTHNSCTFCNFYKDTPFWVAPIEQVEKDLQEASREVPFATRIWASGGNPFCLSSRRLIQLGDLFKKYFPKARVSTYARIDDLFHKSAEDIREIREHGIDDVLTGIESGDDDVLKAVNKGYTAEDVIRECQKIGQARRKCQEERCRLQSDSSLLHVPDQRGRSSRDKAVRSDDAGRVR